MTDIHDVTGIYKERVNDIRIKGILNKVENALIGFMKKCGMSSLKAPVIFKKGEIFVKGELVIFEDGVWVLGPDKSYSFGEVLVSNMVTWEMLCNVFQFLKERLNEKRNRKEG
jgi:hypothetical protein